MPASSDRLGVRFLRPWMPAENEPAEPNALTQSLQLTCSLTPSSTLPSTRLVIIWLKRCLARSLIDPALESAPVGGGAEVGDVVGMGLALEVGVGLGEPPCPGVELGVGEGEDDGDGLGDGEYVGVGDCAADGDT